MRFDKSGNLAKNICKEFTIDEHYSKKVAYLVGIDVLHEVEQARERERERERAMAVVLCLKMQSNEPRI